MTPQTESPFLLFAHEPYYLEQDWREVNTTIVPALALLHPEVRQPDGRRIHALLLQRRRPGEVVPLATLTHELSGGADWPLVGDWEQVTADILHLVRRGTGEALNLRLAEVDRALLCSGPKADVLIFHPLLQRAVAFGPSDRARALARVQKQALHFPLHPRWPRPETGHAGR
ncbi:hypothetical protein [Streptomyces sp. NPDC058595]|uniref:hypothetical protein n=1 Tax=Streptomyces sp. NPDC058595 TaxID=3346550 RepID=UPI00365AABB3